MKPVEVRGNSRANSHVKEKTDTANARLEGSAPPRILQCHFGRVATRRVTPIPKLRRKRRNWSTKGLKATTLTSLIHPIRLLLLASPTSSADFLGLHQRSTVHRGSQSWRMKRKAHHTIAVLFPAGRFFSFCAPRTIPRSGSRLEEREGRTYASPRLDSKYYSAISPAVPTITDVEYRRAITVKSWLIVSSYVRGENRWFSPRNWDNAWKAGTARGRGSLERDHQRRLRDTVHVKLDAN